MKYLIEGSHAVLSLETGVTGRADSKSMAQMCWEQHMVRPAQVCTVW